MSKEEDIEITSQWEEYQSHFIRSRGRAISFGPFLENIIVTLSLGSSTFLPSTESCWKAEDLILFFVTFNHFYVEDPSQMELLA